MNKLTFSLAFICASLVFLSLVTYASAEGNCQPIYGGGQTCNQAISVQLDKLVVDPSDPTGQRFVDNLDVTKAKFAPDQTITFKIVVTNWGTVPLSKVTVKDILPPHIVFVSGPGNFDLLASVAILQDFVFKNLSWVVHLSHLDKLRLKG
jgi:uncharacterized repeat protein (TIGR01451 family)